MTSDRTYTNLTINRERAEAYREVYEKFGLDQTWNNWILDIVESSLSKMKFIKKNLVEYSFAELDGNGFAIFDKVKDSIVRVYFKENKLICSEHKNQLCDHKVYASLHPKFLG